MSQLNEGCDSVSLHKTPMNSYGQNKINNVPQTNSGHLHIQQPRWNAMMPVSQLVVLVSYNFWVQLVRPDLPQERRFKEKEEG